MNGIGDIQLEFVPIGWERNENLSVIHLDAFLRYQMVFYYLTLDYQRKFNLEDKIEEIDDVIFYVLVSFISRLDRWSDLLKESSSIYVTEKIDQIYYELYRDLIKGNVLTYPSIQELSYNSPLNIKFHGSIKALVVAVVISGGNVNISEGKAEMPGLISVVERLNDIVKGYLGYSKENKNMNNEDKVVNYVNAYISKDKK